MMMPKLTTLLVTLPLMALPVSVFAVKPALASGAAEEAVRILSRAKAADKRCDYLSSSERSELGRYTARAELAAASQASTRAAKTASAAGSAEGQNAGCSPSAATDVRETLLAAREAVAESNRNTTAATPRKTPDVRAAQKPETTPTRAGKGDLGLYSRVVKAYYLERHCNSLSRHQVSRFYDAVISLHRDTVVQSGRNAVNRAVRNAERNASKSSCSTNTLAQIERGYEDVTSR